MAICFPSQSMQPVHADKESSSYQKISDREGLDSSSQGIKDEAESAQPSSSPSSREDIVKNLPVKNLTILAILNSRNGKENRNTAPTSETRAFMRGTISQSSSSTIPPLSLDLQQAGQGTKERLSRSCEDQEIPVKSCSGDLSLLSLLEALIPSMPVYTPKIEDLSLDSLSIQKQDTSKKSQKRKAAEENDDWRKKRVFSLYVCGSLPLESEGVFPPKEKSSFLQTALLSTKDLREKQKESKTHPQVKKKDESLTKTFSPIEISRERIVAILERTLEDIRKQTSS